MLVLPGFTYAVLPAADALAALFEKNVDILYGLLLVQPKNDDGPPGMCIWPFTTPPNFLALAN